MAALDPARRSSGDLLGRARAGDRAAFEALVRPHGQRLEALVCSRLGVKLKQAVELDDVVQETLLRALRTLESYDGDEGESLLRWLGGIANNVLHEAARQHARSPVAPGAADVADSGTSAAKRSERRERFERLERAMASLSEEHRRVILLARIRRLPMKDVASRMGRSVEAVTQLLWRALRRLKDKFGSTDSLHLPDASLGDFEDAHDRPGST